jgi:hypothetical protein
MNLGPWIDGLEILSSIGEAVPLLGAPVKGSAEALKLILEYTQVRFVYR